VTLLFATHTGQARRPLPPDVRIPPADLLPFWFALPASHYTFRRLPSLGRRNATLPALQHGDWCILDGQFCAGWITRSDVRTEHSRLPPFSWTLSDYPTYTTTPSRYTRVHAGWVYAAPVFSAFPAAPPTGRHLRRTRFPHRFTPPRAKRSKRAGPLRSQAHTVSAPVPFTHAPHSQTSCPHRDRFAVDIAMRLFPR